MINSATFYSHFDAGFAEVSADSRLTRARGKPSKYVAQTRAGPVDMWFQVNAKASSIPNQPGEFWPVLKAPADLRSDRGHDDGGISWYQYTTPAAVERIMDIQGAVLRKFIAQDAFEHEMWRQMRDASIPMVTLAASSRPEPRFPSTRLLYLDEADARSWGRAMADQALHFIEAFGSQPETLCMYMWRVHWTAPEGGHAV